jgi:pimeloyl-ACP methyl ester carboxylesterase
MISQELSDLTDMRYVVTHMSPNRPASVMSAQPALPPLTRLWGEVAALASLKRRFPSSRTVARPRAAADGAPLMVIPGFLAGDHSTGVLRQRLAVAGYDVHGWGQGLNLGATQARLDRLAEDVSCFAQRRGGPVLLVGWSLGGLYAREVAKRVPGDVARVVTLGSPFSGNPRANRAWRLYEWINGHPVDKLPIECDLAAKPPVQTVALWSRDDGIVASCSARGLAHEADVAIEVSCSHIGFTFEPQALEAVVAAVRDHRFVEQR